MSKKSRKRNKKILGALGAIGLGLALANRGKGTEMSNISVDGQGGGKDASTMKTKQKIYQDDIMRGGTGVKYQKPDLRFGQVIDKEGEVKTIRPFKFLNPGGGENKLKLKDNSLRAKNRKVDIFGNKEPNKPMLATFFPKSKIADDYAADMRDFGRTMQYKSGGRVKKAKATGIAKRGFGRALKKQANKMRKK